MDVFGFALQTIVAFIFARFDGGLSAWNKLKKITFYGWVASEYLATLYVFGDAWRNVFWVAGAICLFIHIFYNDDRWNNLKRRFSATKLRVQTYLAYGVEAKRPLPA